MLTRELIITIDGPAGSGKSTTARLVAERMGYIFLDTGAMYRAVTLKALQKKIDVNCEKLVESEAVNADIQLQWHEKGLAVILDGVDVSRAIRNQEVTQIVSKVSSYPSVRKVLVAKQRELAKNRGVVAEGRDMGTVVFPDAELKIFLSASLEERTRRRQLELEEKGIAINSEKLTREIQLRDELDSTRATSPLKPANDARLLDTTHMTIAQQVDYIVQLAQGLIKKKGNNVGAVTVTIDARAGVCFGVNRAIVMAEEKLEQNSRLFVLGQLIHNRREVERLVKKGLTVVDQHEIENYPGAEKKLHDCQLLIRTHGISESLYRRFNAKNVNLIDATCPIVQRVQKLAREASQQGNQVVIVGKKDHPEVNGILGHCNCKGVVAASEADLAELNPDRPIVLLAQTTISPNLFSHLANYLRTKTEMLKVIDTTCRSIKKRYQQIKEFSRQNDLLLIVGGKDSSNTRLFFTLARSVNRHCYHIESVKDIQPYWLARARKIGITSGASTPLWQLVEIRDFIEFETRKGYK